MLHVKTKFIELKQNVEEWMLDFYRNFIIIRGYIIKVKERMTMANVQLAFFFNKRFKSFKKSMAFVSLQLFVCGDLYLVVNHITSCSYVL